MSLKSLLTLKQSIFGFRNYQYSFDNLKTNNNLAFIDEIEFSEAYKIAVGLVGKDLEIPLRIHQALWCGLNSLKIEGDLVELGCGAGFTFISLLNYFKLKNLDFSNKGIYLFDSFLPVKPDSSGNQSVIGKMRKPDAYANSKDEVKERFKQWPNVKLVDGLLPASINKTIDSIRSISFLHVDLNHFQAEISSLEILYEKVSNGGLLLLDDYANPGRDIQRVAHNNFFKI
ncbi:MAG: TylF/MycF/NovP-related O-methyltransferase, partial [Flavobacterium sp.]|uniref:TylF/MycF/NovP-related O-methyltransferase n=1 Tax=Flavobacterium sp. TaxID=239 RepID=UPI003BDEC1C4